MTSSHRNGTGPSNTWHKASGEACSHDDNEPRPPALPPGILSLLGPPAPPSSHGRPFAAVSFTGWSVDYALVLILNSLTDSVLYAVVGARIVSCTLGFLLNRRLFGASPESFWRSTGGYAAVQGGGRGDILRRHRGPHRGRSTSVAGQGARGLHALHRQLPAQSRLVYRAPAEQSVPALATAA